MLIERLALGTAPEVVFKIDCIDFRQSMSHALSDNSYTSQDSSGLGRMEKERPETEKKSCQWGIPEVDHFMAMLTTARGEAPSLLTRHFSHVTSCHCGHWKANAKRQVRITDSSSNDVKLPSLCAMRCSPGQLYCWAWALVIEGQHSWLR